VLTKCPGPNRSTSNTDSSSSAVVATTDGFLVILASLPDSSRNVKVHRVVARRRRFDPTLGAHSVDQRHDPHRLNARLDLLARVATSRDLEGNLNRVCPPCTKVVTVQLPASEMLGPSPL
jgi:hypothetical protein